MSSAKFKPNIIENENGNKNGNGNGNENGNGNKNGNKNVEFDNYQLTITNNASCDLFLNDHPCAIGNVMVSFQDIDTSAEMRNINEIIIHARRYALPSSIIDFDKVKYSI